MSVPDSSCQKLNRQLLDDFCSGLLVVNTDRKIVFCNAYMSNLSRIPSDQLVNTPISDWFTKASNIFLDSYVYPLLASDTVLEESQMTWLAKNGDAVPVVVNIKLKQDGMSYWSLYVSINRDKLYTELINTREELEARSKELYQLATTDSLTGLLNRRELLAQVGKVASQANRSGTTYAVLAVDVDFFKKVNDEHGHQAGDRVLVRLAQQLTAGRRTNDFVARIGGEEFILVLADNDENSAFELAEKIRISIAEHIVGDIPITVSIGVVVSPKQARMEFSELMALADSALYESKRTGRNKSTVISAIQSTQCRE